MAEAVGLKLKARDLHDMDVIAACLQDALVPLADTAFLPKERRFVMVANRFMWERSDGLEPPSGPREEDADGNDAAFDEAEPRAIFYRVNCGVTFERVRRVKSRNLNRRARDQLLNLLTMASEPHRVRLLFSEGAEIELEVSELRCRLEDIGEPWPTWAQPQHPLDEAGSAR